MNYKDSYNLVFSLRKIFSTGFYSSRDLYLTAALSNLSFAIHSLNKSVPQSFSFTLGLRTISFSFTVIFMQVVLLTCFPISNLFLYDLQAENCARNNKPQFQHNSQFTQASPSPQSWPWPWSCPVFGLPGWVLAKSPAKSSPTYDIW